MSKKHDIEYVRAYFEDNGCKLLSTEYKDNRTNLKYRCHCGNESQISFYHFKSGQRCDKCARLKRANTKRFDYQHVYDYFKKHDCELLSKRYTTTRDKLKYRCSCGNEDEISVGNFKRGKRCKKCMPDKIRKSLVDGGWAIPDNELSLWKLYNRKVRTLTERIYRKYKKTINPNDLPRLQGLKGYHLDHRFSVFEGFKNNIPPYVVANINNLQIVTGSDNITKGPLSSIGLYELLNDYKHIIL